MQYDAIEFLEALFASPDMRQANVRTDLPPEWVVAWDERAAVMEYDGGLPRERAEYLALLEVMDQMRQAGVHRASGEGYS